MPYRPLRIAELRGFELRLDPSLVLLVVLLVWAFTARFVGAHGLVPALSMATVAALLVVATTLLHELAHALEARRRGLEVESITLLLFGGVTEMHAMSPTPRDELAVAAVGPYSSLFAAAVAGLTATLLPEVSSSPGVARAAEVAGLLGWWNLALAVFNFVPGAPLDGGRVLRALLWMLLGDRLRALRASVRAGQLLAAVLVAAGVWIATRPTADTPTAIAVAGVFIVTAAALFHAARLELRQAELDALLSGHRVADVVAVTPRVPGGAPAGPTCTVVGLDDDLHTLVAQFTARAHEVRVVADGHVVATLREPDVAGALEALRRRPARPGQPEPAS